MCVLNMEFKTSQPLNQTKLRQFLNEEDEFVSKLLNSLPATQNVETDERVVWVGESKPTFAKKSKLKRNLGELMEKVEDKKGNMEKKRLSYKEKLQARNIKARRKKQQKQLQRKQLKNKTKEVVDNTNGIIKEEIEKRTRKTPPESFEKVIYTKIDFQNTPIKTKHSGTALKVTLNDLIEKRKQIDDLKQKGDIQGAVKKSEKQKIKSAILRARGEKVKDDIKLLSQTISRRTKAKKKSKKEWEARTEKVDKEKKDRQQKREDNLNKRKKEKKTKKFTKAAKRGRIVL